MVGTAWRQLNRVIGVEHYLAIIVRVYKDTSCDRLQKHSDIPPRISGKHEISHLSLNDNYSLITWWLLPGVSSSFTGDNSGVYLGHVTNL